MPPRDVVDFLVITFFRNAQANQFYIHPEIFNRKLNALYDGTGEFDIQKASDSKRSSEFICLMFMVFTIGSQFAEVEIPAAESTRCSLKDQQAVPGFADNDGRVTDLSRLVIPKPSRSPGWPFYEISRRLLPDVVVSSSMTSIQICVLQGIFLPSAESRDAGYNLLGLALRMAVNMGMHRSFGAEALHPNVRELRNRLWWSVYVAERIFSVEMGRPLAINDAEIDAPLPVNVPEWSNMAGKPMNVDGQIAMIRLCNLLGKIINEVYCKPGCGEECMISSRKIERLQDEIRQSRDDLPDDLKGLPEQAIPRSVAHLLLAYEQATILLTRSCLNHAAAAKHTYLLNNEALLSNRNQAQVCINSAVTTIKIMFSLRSRSLLCRFSFHDSLYFASALYVLLLGRSLDWVPDAIIRESWHHGLLILLDLAQGSEIATEFLRYFVRYAQKNPEDSFFCDTGASSEEATLEKGRKAWRAWIAQPTRRVSRSEFVPDTFHNDWVGYSIHP